MRVTEPVHIFVEKLGRVEVSMDGGFARFLLCVTRFDADGTTEERVAAVVTMPISAIPDAILKATEATALALVGTAESAVN
jgi:hypothetical protein